MWCGYPVDKRWTVDISYYVNQVGTTFPGIPVPSWFWE